MPCTSPSRQMPGNAPGIDLECPPLALCSWSPWTPILPTPSSWIHDFHLSLCLCRLLVHILRGSSLPRDQTLVSCIAGRFFSVWAQREAPNKSSFLLITSACLVAPSCPTFCDPIDWRRQWHPTPVLLPGKSHGRLSNFTFTFHLHTLEKEMATHSSVLAWRIPGTGEPGGLPSMGSHRVGHDWSDLAAAAADCILPGSSVRGIFQAGILE